jgi:hypothetical protein
MRQVYPPSKKLYRQSKNYEVKQSVSRMSYTPKKEQQEEERERESIYLDDGIFC